MKKTLFAFILSAALLLALTACGSSDPAAAETPAAETPAAETPAAETPAAETQDTASETGAPDAGTMTAFRADGSAVILEDCGDGTWKDENGLLYYQGTDGVLRARGEEDLYAEPPSAEGRQDGERFETVIMLEGMEETVRYEHVVNRTAGFEMDYDYESLTRRSEADREIFVSVWDDPEKPENYLEVAYREEDADTVAASVGELLSQEYELITGSRELEGAGNCIRIEASELKNGGGMADELQTVYIIPASDGCRVAEAHYTAESAEGFGRRFSYMLNTIAVIGG